MLAAGLTWQVVARGWVGGVEFEFDISNVGHLNHCVRFNTTNIDIFFIF
jgi:hypothetical protein